jgi:hypothetical protein
MSWQVLEGTWEEILEHRSELQGRRLRVIVLPDAELAHTDNTGADLLEYLTQIGFVGLWSDRTDLPDSPEYVRQMRQTIERRPKDASAGH